jgi:tellurite resistance protein TehA-like permease
MSAAEKSHDHVRPNPFLSALPISSFAMVMGLSGLALVWGRVANLGWLPGLAGGVALGLSLLVGLTFAVLLVLYIRKWARNHQQVYEEWQHPVKSSFFAGRFGFLCIGGDCCVGRLCAPGLTPMGGGCGLADGGDDDGIKCMGTS